MENEEVTSRKRRRRRRTNETDHSDTKNHSKDKEDSSHRRKRRKRAHTSSKDEESEGHSHRRRRRRRKTETEENESSEDETSPQPPKTAQALLIVKNLLKTRPEIAPELQIVLKTIDSGEVVNVDGIPDALIKELLVGLFLALSLRTTLVGESLMYSKPKLKDLPPLAGVFDPMIEVTTKAKDESKTEEVESEDEEDEEDVGPSLHNVREVDEDVLKEQEKKRKERQQAIMNEYAKQRGETIEGKLERQQWMLELPTDLVGFKANPRSQRGRTFTKSGIMSKDELDHSWTDTPAEKARKERMKEAMQGPMKPKVKKLSYKENAEREVQNRLRIYASKFAQKSLLEQHLESKAKSATNGSQKPSSYNYGASSSASFQESLFSTQIDTQSFAGKLSSFKDRFTPATR
eukprot:TRINITY_DN422198_c0_g1_i1.p1 TRINITY_DN422198_c0_g1~~TRINITY_DN422198_c0_g1_i1.p1  ORF type:complete len:405 (+),score=126.64 TRINITY_DN422198_c0_g1_i1:77-1291(+)